MTHPKDDSKEVYAQKPKTGTETSLPAIVTGDKKGKRSLLAGVGFQSIESTAEKAPG